MVVCSREVINDSLKIDCCYFSIGAWGNYVCCICDIIHVIIMIRKTVRFMFGPRALLYTNVLSSGVMMGFGDWIVQKIVEKTDNTQQKIDWERTRNCPFSACLDFLGNLLGYGMACSQSIMFSFRIAIIVYRCCIAAATGFFLCPTDFTNMVTSLFH